jgi:hypothetical protein
MSATNVIVHLQTTGAQQFTLAMNNASGSVQHLGSTTSTTQSTVTSSTGRMRRAWGGMIKGMAAMGGIAAAQKLLRDSVTGAVDLNEEVNKTGTVFRANGADLIKWSKDSAKSLGMSQQQALEAAGTMGNMLVPMGMTREKAAGMSKSLISLSSDMASFNNASPEQTLEALRSGLSGETEPLRKFGVFLNEARVKAEAMSMGIVKNARDTGKIKTAQMAAEIAQRKYNKAVAEHGRNSEQARAAALGNQRAQDGLTRATKGTVPQLTAAQKAQATYSLIMKDSKDAQGDFAKTSGGLANQQRILKAQYANVAASLGQALLPSLTKLAGVLSTLADNMNIVLPIIGVLTVAFIAYKVATIAATIASLGLQAAWLLIPLAIAAVVAGLIIAYKKVDWFRAAVDFLVVKIKEAFNWLKNNWKVALVAIIAGPFGIAALVIAKNWDKIKDGARGVLNWFKDFGHKMVQFIVDGIKAAPGMILDAIKALLPGGKVGKKLTSLILPGFAFGGVQTRSGMAVVGERGPELVQLPGGARVTPLPAGGGVAPALGGTSALNRPITTQVYLDRRMIATAIAEDTADQKARR